MTRLDLYNSITLWLKHYPKQKDKILRPQTFAVLQEFYKDLHAENLNKQIEDKDKKYFWNRELDRSGRYDISSIIKEVPICIMYEKSAPYKIQGNNIKSIVNYELGFLFSHNKKDYDYGYKYVINDYYMLSRRFIYQLIHYIKNLQKYTGGATSVYLNDALRNVTHSGYIKDSNYNFKSKFIGVNNDYNAGINYDDDAHNLYGAFVDIKIPITECIVPVNFSIVNQNPLYVTGCID